MTSAPTAPGTVPVVTLPLVAALEQTWAAIRAHHPDTPPVVVTLGSGTLGERGNVRLGHFAEARWQVGETRHAELFIGGEGLQRGAADVLATLLHEAAHGVATTRSIQDTSRQGRYHNRKFKALAEELGLQVAEDSRIGWSPSTLAAGTADTYAAELEQLAAALTAYRHPEPTRSRSKNKSSGNGIVAICGCDDPRRIRVRSRATFERAPILCGECGKPFAIEGDDEASDDDEG
jgi:hypothetical protein